MNMDINTVAVKQAAVKTQILLVIAVITIMMLGAVTAQATTYPILHNSSTANAKNYWSAAGGWGVTATSAYGRFTCQTCHSPTASKNNIMRIRSSVSLPAVGGTTAFNRKVVFTNRTGANSYGDDSVAYSTTHTNVCEVCHTLTDAHRYNSNIGVINHNNSARKDCTGCHAHSNGFKAAGCNGCHGYTTAPWGMVSSPAPTYALGNPAPANIGAHDAHAITMNMACVTCHNNLGTMSGGTSNNQINLQFAVNGTNWPKFTGGNSVAFGSISARANTDLNTGITYNAGTGTTITQVAGYAKLLTCNVYCHGNWAGTGGTAPNPRWNVPADGACGGCHYTTNAAVPATGAAGSHSKHAATGTANYSIKCSACHNIAVNTTNHIQGKSYVSFDSASAAQIGTGAASYKGTSVMPVGSTGLAGIAANYGACSNIYCHSNGQSKGGVGVLYRTTPNWGSGALNCGSCHNNMATFANASSGDHVKHAQTYGFSCNRCHGPGYSSTTVNTATHVNKQIDLQFMSSAQGTAYLKGTGYAPGTAYSTCSTSYCHSNGQSDNAKARITRTTPQWGVGTTTCGSCHNDMKTFANASSGSHKAHAQLAGYDCSLCHSGYTSTTVNYATHVNKKINLGFAPIAPTNAVPVYSKYSAAGFTPGKGYYGTCVAVCHGSGRPTWGYSSGLPACYICHGSTAGDYMTNYSSATIAPGGGTAGRDTGGNTTSTYPRVGAHQQHLLAQSQMSQPIHCGECHTVHTTVTDPTHLNYTTARITFQGPISKNTYLGTASPSVTRVSGAIQCSNVECHVGTRQAGTAANQRGNITTVWSFNGTSILDNSTINGTCVNKCHGLPPGGGLSGDTHSAIAPLTGTIQLQQLAQCSSLSTGCHPDIKNLTGKTQTAFVSLTSIFVNKGALHIDGVVEGGTCTGCHNSTQGGEREDAAAHFSQQSHHVQGRAVAVTDCAACHYEANVDGSINSTYHTQVKGKAVNLVQWNNGMTGSSLANRATQSTLVNYTANGQRHEIKKINNVCLGCHNDSNRGFKPFNTYSTIKYSPEARLATPKAKTSILSRYSSTRTVSWSNYTFTNSSGQTVKYGTNRKTAVTKALSAHGNASKNVMPTWDTTYGEDETMPNYSYSGNSGNRNVFCYDCHNSHGSAAAGITSSYSSATGRNKGGLLKTTTAGLGGYAATYQPAARTVNYKNYSTTSTTAAVFNPGASICNDCHNSGNPRGATLTKPWNILTTYSSTKSIVGYWSTPYFDNYTVNSAKRTPYKAGGAVGTIKDMRKPMGGHFGSSINGDSVKNHTPGPTGTINGLCTPCHDPHGVSNALGADRDHGVPLLKGTWVTSPYREDRATVSVKRGGGSNYTGMAAMGSMPGYNIDQNTLIALPAAVNGGAYTTTAKSNKRSQIFTTIAGNALSMHNEKTPTVFAGLCLECHTQTALTGAAAATTTQTWMTKERVHQTVAGWGPTNGTNINNTQHAYTCSKCHTPHVSRLPRLMVTNCLDVRHVKRQVSGGSIIATPTGTAATSYGNVLQSYASTAYGAGRFPGGGSRYSGTPGSAQNNGPWYFQLTQPTVATYPSSCHNATNAGGATYDPTKQIWNKKTRW